LAGSAFRRITINCTAAAFFALAGLFVFNAAFAVTPAALTFLIACCARTWLFEGPAGSLLTLALHS
jgi:hypothetical protein